MTMAPAARVAAIGPRAQAIAQAAHHPLRVGSNADDLFQSGTSE
jgi:hypothetical protein